MRRSALATFAALVTLAGCARQSGAPRDEPIAANPAAPCDGQRMIVIRNDTRGDVDVYVTPSSTGTPRFLASVRPGVHRVTLPEPVFRAYGQQNGRRVGAGRGREDNVSFEFRCERA